MLSRFRFLAVLLIGLNVFTASAQASNKVSAPDVNKGEVQLEYRGGYDFDDEYKRNDQATHKFVTNYGITNRWRTEVKAILGDNHGDYDFTFIEWGNRYQLIKDDATWPKLSLQETYKFSLYNNIADRIELTVLASKNLGKFANITNINLEDQIGNHRGKGTSFNVAWKTFYRLDPIFQPGAEIYGDFGNLSEHNPHNTKKSLIGPTVTGTFPNNLRYDFGTLFGITDAAPDFRLKLILTYVF